MAKTIAIRQYFEKYGFEDGDNVGLLRKALEMRPRVVKLLNSEFRRRGLSYRTVPLDYETSHNPVRTCLQWEEEGKRYEWEDGEMFREAPTGSIAMMEKAGEGHPPGVVEVLRVVQRKLMARR